MDLSNFLNTVQKKLVTLETTVQSSGPRLASEFVEAASYYVDNNEPEKTVSFVTSGTKTSVNVRVSNNNLELLLQYFKLKVRER